MKTTAERSIEALTWAAVVIWLGMVLIMDLLGYPWLVMMVLGIILLSSAIYQRSRGWHTSLAIWVFGIWMAVFSVIDAVNTVIGAMNNGKKLNISLGVYLGIALVSMGVASALRIVQGSVFTGNGSAAQRGSTRQAYSGDPRPSAPRLLNDSDYSAGYFPPSQGSARSGRTYGRGAISEQPTQLDQQEDYGYDQPLQPEEAGDYGYDQPEQYEPQYGRQDVYEQPPQSLPSRGSRYNQPEQYDTSYGRRDAYQQPPQAAPRRDYRYDQGYDQVAPQDQGEYNAPPRRSQPIPDRRRAAPQRRRSAQPAEAPSDLESRVEDIIRRSRERRNAPPDNLPY
ncbi:MAG TPA: hypothetical protein VMT24_15920 [Aggregatilineaceae bacterium]|nr:hypothetical protein [Aggregatilineaceae bacterium]